MTIFWDPLSAILNYRIRFFSFSVAKFVHSQCSEGMQEIQVYGGRHVLPQTLYHGCNVEASRRSKKDSPTRLKFAYCQKRTLKDLQKPKSRILQDYFSGQFTQKHHHSPFEVFFHFFSPTKSAIQKIKMGLCNLLLLTM